MRIDLQFTLISSSFLPVHSHFFFDSLSFYFNITSALNSPKNQGEIEGILRIDLQFRIIDSSRVFTLSFIESFGSDQDQEGIDSLSFQFTLIHSSISLIHQ